MKAQFLYRFKVTFLHSHGFPFTESVTAHGFDVLHAMENVRFLYGSFNVIEIESTGENNE